MGHHDLQQVCLNGHQITDSFNSSPEFRKNFCATCGAATIYKCPQCGLGIPGDYKADGVIAMYPSGEPHPAFALNVMGR